jgi:hypothetical protein
MSTAHSAPHAAGVHIVQNVSFLGQMYTKTADQRLVRAYLVEALKEWADRKGIRNAWAIEVQ